MEELDRGDKFDYVWSIMQESDLSCHIVDKPMFTTAVSYNNPSLGNKNGWVHTQRFVGIGAATRIKEKLRSCKEKGATRAFLYRAWYDDEGPGTIYIRWTVIV